MELGLASYLIVAVVAFGAQILGGIAGYGTGLILPIVLVPLIGPQLTIPVIALSALLTNPTRAWNFREHIDWRPVLTIVAFAFPGVLLGAFGFTLLTGTGAQIVIGVMLTFLVPLRRLLRRRRITLAQGGLRSASLLFGLLMGGTSGSGIVLISILMTRGLAAPAVIATDAVVSTILGVAKVGVFASAGSLPPSMLLLALVIGSMAVPGAWIGKWMLLRFSISVQDVILDMAVLTGGLVMLLTAMTR